MKKKHKGDFFLKCCFSNSVLPYYIRIVIAENKKAEPKDPASIFWYLDFI